MKTAPYFHTAIIGGGASGLFCAGSFQAAKIVLEANSVPARKVAVSGGGKCNFSNRFVSAADYVCQQKHFCKNALAAFKPTDFISLLDTAHIPWEERAHGQLFAYRAQDIVDFLVHRAKTHHTTLALGTRVLSLSPHPVGFTLLTSQGTIHAKHVVLATGGLSFPSLGANSFGIQTARQLGLQQVEQRPVLCGLTFPKELRAAFALLAGNSLPVRIRQGKHLFEGPLLFTHEGISGPAVLRLSLVWNENTPIEIDFLPQTSVSTVLAQHKNSTRSLASVLSEFLPPKLVRHLLKQPDTCLANASRAQMQAAHQAIHHFQVIPTGTSGYTKAEATAGGVDTREVNPSTLEVRKIPGLFITGELLDVTGSLGGFNLHWAWASAYAAAQALRARP